MEAWSVNHWNHQEVQNAKVLKKNIGAQGWLAGKMRCVCVYIYHFYGKFSLLPRIGKSYNSSGFTGGFGVLFGVLTVYDYLSSLSPGLPTKLDRKNISLKATISGLLYTV